MLLIDLLNSLEKANVLFTVTSLEYNEHVVRFGSVSVDIIDNKRVDIAVNDNDFITIESPEISYCKDTDNLIFNGINNGYYIRVRPDEIMNKKPEDIIV